MNEGQLMQLRSMLLGTACARGKRIRVVFSDGLQPDSTRVDILRARCSGRSRGFKQVCAVRRRSVLALRCIVGEGRGYQRGRYGRRSSQHAADKSVLGEKPGLRFIELRNSEDVQRSGQADDALTAFGARCEARARYRSARSSLKPGTRRST